MKLKIEPAIKNIFGLWEVTIQINGKKYKYELAEYDYNFAMSHYKAGRYTNCLAVLNKFNEATHE